MAASTLSLSIEKGPKKGEALECKLGSSILIGRVVRGNTLAIKDPGISQKHLAIRYLPEFNRWTATDLGSSNGTFINGTLLSPDEPSSLSDGDVIVIGESTSMSVNISAPVAQPVALRRRGRLPKLRKESEGRNRISRKVEALNPERRVTRASARACSTRVSKNKVEDEAITVSDSGNAYVAEEKMPKESNADVAEELMPKERNADVGEKEGGIEEVDDMDSMTLWEWFDRMEKFLPKTINMAAEEIIAKLREKARLFDDFVDHNSNPGADE